MKEKTRRYLPFVLSFSIIVLDQLSKLWVVKTIEENTIGYSFLDGLVWIVHVRNNAVAFSLGENVPTVLKYIFFVFVPLLIMVFVAFLIALEKTDSEFSSFQKWCLAGILGGGMGNIIDRIFRSLRVVDFISVKFYGLFGLERFPTWNLADASVVVSVVLLIISMTVTELKNRKEKK